MKVRVGIAMLSLCMLAGVVGAQEKQGGQQTPPAISQGDMEAMMKAGTPGENHKHLGRMAGNWNTSMKSWMAPGTPPMESKGTMQGEWILGGRYLQSTYKGDFMGQPFEGRSTEAYDNVTQQFQSTWIDSLSTAIMVSTGTCDAGCKTMTMTGDMPDPTTGKTMTVKSVTTFPDANSWKMEMYGQGPDGTSFKMMELLATKK
ncbi:MAG TPA: DUF1579 domain-containing protein [Thermoanaerobaculia bacterium]|nr:DUF1579 domain-containing protein [Thermoanaerobaculia bacterium]